MKHKNWLFLIILLVFISSLSFADTRMENLPSLGAKPAVDDKIPFTDISTGTSKNTTVLNLLNIPNVDSYGGLEAAITAIGATEMTVAINSAQTLTANREFVSTLSVVILKGGILTIATGKTLTINGPFEAGIYQVFSGTGDVVFGEGKVKGIYPQWWGAVGDGTADDTVEIQAAYDATVTANADLLLLSGIYKTSATLTFDGNVDVIGFGEDTIIQPTVAVATAISFDPVVNATSGYFHPVKLSNFYLDGSNTSAAIGIIVGSTATEVASAVLENMTVTMFKDAGAIGLKVRNSVSFTSKNSIYSKNAMNVILAGEVASVPTTTYFLGGSIRESSIDEGMLIEASAQTLFDRVIFESNKKEGLVIAPITTYNAAFNKLSNCWFESNYEDNAAQYSLVIDGTVAGTTAGVYLDSVYFNISGASEKAINFNKATEVTLTDVTIGSGAGLVDGIYVQDANTRITVINGSQRHDWSTIINYAETVASVAFLKDDVTPNLLDVDSATPCVGYGNYYYTANTGATLISFLDNGHVGQHVKIRIGDATTTIDFSGTNMYGNAGVDWNGAAHDWLECVFDGTRWYCAVHDCTS